MKKYKNFIVKRSQQNRQVKANGNFFDRLLTSSLSLSEKEEKLNREVRELVQMFGSEKTKCGIQRCMKSTQDDEIVQLLQSAYLSI